MYTPAVVKVSALLKRFSQKKTTEIQEVMEQFFLFSIRSPAAAVTDGM